MGHCRAAYVMIFLLAYLHVVLTDQVEYVNVALRKPTHQISTMGSTGKGGASSLAVDGDHNPHHGSKKPACAHTASRINNFWVVDLLCSYPIQFINITNRDANVDRLTEFFIYVSDVNPVPALEKDRTLTGDLCLSYPGTIPAAGPHSLTCQTPGPVYGRYVYVWKPKNSYLMICEFEVFVDKAYDMNYNDQSVVSVIAGKRTTKPPVFIINMERSSIASCTMACFSTGKGKRCGAAAQVNKDTNICECVEGLGEFVPDLQDASWTMTKFLED